MSIIKRLCVAVIAAAATVLPVGAEIQEGTSSLLQTIDKEGILVTINSEQCLTNGSNGQYRWLGFKREMVLCPGDTIDANDHNTVRHEVIHAIQHCINLTRRTNFDTPIIQNVPDLMKFVNTHLSQHEINSITSVYDRSQWLTELEAFAGARAYTSSQLEKFFIDVCTLQESFDG